MERLSQLEVENKALQEEILRFRSAHQRDIDSLEQRLAIEVKYRESQQGFQTIFEQSKLGNKIIAKDLRIIKVNHALELILGYSQKELVDTKVLAYAHPDYIHPWLELQQNLWSESIPSFGIEPLLLRKDGSLIWCHVISILFHDGDDLLGYTILEDITERKALEQKLKKMYDAQETIIYMVSHDLKNPIHTIKIISGYLKRQVEAFQQIDAPMKDQSLTFIELIAKSCDRAYHIIKDLLLIGEIELGKLTFNLVNTGDEKFS
jgi:two-component system sensor histidine kinase VicK